MRVVHGVSCCLCWCWCCCCCCCLPSTCSFVWVIQGIGTALLQLTCLSSVLFMVSVAASAAAAYLVRVRLFELSRVSVQHCCSLHVCRVVHGHQCSTAAAYVFVCWAPGTSYRRKKSVVSIVPPFFFFFSFLLALGAVPFPFFFFFFSSINSFACSSVCLSIRSSMRFISCFFFPIKQLILRVCPFWFLTSSSNRLVANFVGCSGVLLVLLFRYFSFWNNFVRLPYNMYLVVS